MNKKSLLFSFVFFCFLLFSFVFFYQKKVNNYNSMDSSLDLKKITKARVEKESEKIEKFNRLGEKDYVKEYEIIIHRDNDLITSAYVVSRNEFSNGNKSVSAEYIEYQRNSVYDDYTYARDGGMSSGLTYEQTIEEIKKNNPKNFSAEEFRKTYKTDRDGIIISEDRYYLGQDIRNLTKGLPAVVWRAWSPNYKNLVYVYKNEISLDRKNPPEFGTRVFIENGDEDLVFNSTVPFSYFPEFPDGFYDFNPIIFIDDQEFYFIAQNNWGAENKGKFASDKIKSLTENGEEVLAGVYAFNAETLEYRLIDKLPATGRKYKYITYENKMYVYGGDLENVRVYNNNGELEKTLEYNGRERNLAVITFVNWGTRVEDGIKKDIAMFENNDVTNYVEGISIVLE